MKFINKDGFHMLHFSELAPTYDAALQLANCYRGKKHNEISMQGYIKFKMTTVSDRSDLINKLSKAKDVREQALIKHVIHNTKIGLVTANLSSLPDIITDGYEIEAILKSSFPLELCELTMLSQENGLYFFTIKKN